jgi:hypothetical protein
MVRPGARRPWCPGDMPLSKCDIRCLARHGAQSSEMALKTVGLRRRILTNGPDAASRPAGKAGHRVGWLRVAWRSAVGGWPK